MRQAKNGNRWHQEKQLRCQRGLYQQGHQNYDYHTGGEKCGLPDPWISHFGNAAACKKGSGGKDAMTDSRSIGPVDPDRNLSNLSVGALRKRL